ncbi:hypothetical protein Ancab_007692 [Ancistrocladus abbreviatus]
MMRNSRKLLTSETEQTIPTSQNPIYDIPPETLSPLSSNNSSSSSKIKSESSITTSSSSFGNSNSSPPFDSTIALTILVLLTALFFVGLFSIYICRFAEDSSVDLTRRRRGSSSPFAARMGGKEKGVDLAVLQALPVYAYGSSAKKGTDASECAICLSEYEESECVKVIPLCGHVFHVSCIDAWLSSHVTCPLCRTVDLFSTAEGKAVKEKQVVLEVEEEEVEEETVLSVAQVEGAGECNETELRSREDERNTWNGERDIVGPMVLTRRTSSSPWLSEQVVLRRTLSF